MLGTILGQAGTVLNVGLQKKPNISTSLLKVPQENSRVPRRVLKVLKFAGVF